MEFKDVYKDLIDDNNLNIKLWSKQIKIRDSILYEYLYGRLPNVEYAVKLANYFNCSLNYLMGLDSEPNLIKFKDSYKISLFSSRYDNLLNVKNITHYKLSKESGLNYSSHYAWRHNAIPKMESLIKIANYFDVSIDYLVGRSDKK